MSSRSAGVDLPPAGIRHHVFLLYALSGFISLGYQVAWFRILVDWFGSTSLTFTLVVSGFIGGLGCGALLSPSIGAWLAARTGLRDRLRLYGLVEILVGLSALLTPLAGHLPADLVGSFPFRMAGGIWFPTISYEIVQVLTAAICVFVPCLFMGVTFPLLCDAFRRSDASRCDDRLPSTLYAWNTLGACAGILVCQFTLILWFGHGAVFWLMLSLNLGLGGFFLLRGGAPSAAPTSPADRLLTTQDSSAVGWIAAAVLSGLLAGGLEGDLFRRLGFIIVLSPGATMSFVSFWAVLGIFIASLIVGRMRQLRLTHIKFAYILAWLGYITLWRYSDELTYLLGAPVASGAVYHFPVSLGQLFVYTGIYVLPVYLPVALLLPFACNRLQQRGHHLGLAYGLNTIAFCLGLITFALLAPAVNIFYSLKLFLAIMAVATVGLLLLSEARPLRIWLPAGLTTLAAIAASATPRSFDPDFFTPAMWPHVLPATDLRGNAAHTTYVLQLPDRNLRLFFGRLSMSGTSMESQRYMRLMAHFPLLMHPDPQKALLICFGVGNTASAIAAHESVRQIDAVDLNADVFRTAPRFQAFHDNVQNDPRLRLINADGRSFLRLTDERYDLITSEPPPPLAGGAYRLYSRQYYEQALNHLSPDGMMTQWLPEGQMPRAAIELVVRTFVNVFPHSLLFVGSGDHLILLGSRAALDLQHLYDHFDASAAARMDLGRVGIFSPGELSSRVLLDGAALRNRLGPGRVLSDQHNDLEHLLHDPAEEHRDGYRH